MCALMTSLEFVTSSSNDTPQMHTPTSCVNCHQSKRKVFISRIDFRSKPTWTLNIVFDDTLLLRKETQKPWTCKLRFFNPFAMENPMLADKCRWRDWKYQITLKDSFDRLGLLAARGFGFISSECKMTEQRDSSAGDEANNWWDLAGLIDA